MRTSLLLLFVITLPAAVCRGDVSPFSEALTAETPWIVRGQNPGPLASAAPLAAPPDGVTTYYPPTYADPNAPVLSDPFNNPVTPTYPSPITQDPWGGGAGAPYATPAQPFYTYGMNGPQPRRFGWQSRYDIFWIPNSGTSKPNVGDMGIFGVDLEKEYTRPVGYNWAMSIAPQFGYRSVQGPDAATPTTDLPGGLYRFGLGLELTTPTVGGWTMEFGFNPAIGTDLESSLTSDAYMFDGHIVSYWQMTPRWMWALGALYWDRVDDIILPYGGAVWTPNDIWEFRIIFPEPRITVFVGTPFGVPTWLYVGGEYHVEAYQVDPRQMPDETRVQFRDIRLTGGVRWETGWLTSFIEAGYLFDRDVEYRSPGSQFDVDDAFIGRIGFRY